MNIKLNPDSVRRAILEKKKNEVHSSCTSGSKRRDVRRKKVAEKRTNVC